jgi:hypothetical protein
VAVDHPEVDPVEAVPVAAVLLGEATRIKMETQTSKQTDQHDIWVHVYQRTDDKDGNNLGNNSG